MKIRHFFESGAGVILGAVSHIHPMVQALLLLIVLDIVSGILAGYIKRDLDSAISARGMAKKAYSLILVAVAGVLQTFFPEIGINLAAMVAAFYCAHEVISIVENAGRAELPVPKFLLAALSKLNQQVKR